jgi:simple sugar transport system permease protein
VEDGFAIVVLTLSATLRVATPLILGAMAGLFSERSGIIDISLEGKMLASAFAAATVAALSDSAWIALGAGILIAGAFALVHGYACITQKGNQVVSGIALNILASGLTIVLGNAWFHRGG